MSATKAKPKQKILSPLESFKEILTGVGDSLKNDVAKAIPQESWAQFIGVDDHKKGTGDHGGGDTHEESHDSHGETDHGSSHAAESHGSKESHKITTISGVLNPGEWLNLLQLTGPAEHTQHAEAPKNPNIAPGHGYHREMATISETSSRQKNIELERRFVQIKDELNRMVDSSNKIIQDEFGDLTVEQAPAHVGDYHINFLDWMLIAIQTARQKVEDSGAWLSAMRGKNGKKNGGMLLDAQRKGNTSVSMSNERSVATQTG